MFKELHIKISTEDASDIADRLDLDGDGTISYKEFEKFCLGKRSRPPSSPRDRRKAANMLERKVQDQINELAQTRSGIPDFRTVFEDIDRHGDGELSAHDLKKALRVMKIKLDDDDVLDLVERLDQDGDGKISYSEFESFALGRTRRKRNL